MEARGPEYASYGPGALGGFFEGEILLTIFEMDDSEEFFEAFVSSLEARQSRASRNVTRLDGANSNSALFDYRGLSGSADRVAAITAHDGIVTLAIGPDDMRDEVLARSRNLETVEKSFSEDQGVERSLASLDGDRSARLAVAMETSRFAGFIGSKTQSERCRAADSRLIERVPRITILLSEGSSKLALQARIALDEETQRSLDGLLSPAFDVSRAVSTELPIAFSFGTNSIQNLMQKSTDEAFADCDNLAGLYTRLRHWFAGAETIESGAADGTMRMVVGVENLGVDILTSAPQMISRTEWTDEAAANQAVAAFAPDLAELEPIGVVTFDDTEQPIRQLSVASSPRFFAQSGADLWLSNHQFTEASVTSLLTVSDAEVPMMLVVSPSAMRRLMTLMQRQMEVAVENILSGYPQAEVDRARASAVLELTNYFIDQLKTVALLTITATMDDGDFVIEIQ